MLTDEGSPLSSGRECLYAADGDYNKKLKPIEILDFGVQFQWIHQQNTQHLRLKKHCQSRGGKIVRDRIREFDVRFCLLVRSEAASIQSYQHKCSAMS